MKNLLQEINKVTSRNPLITHTYICTYTNHNKITNKRVNQRILQQGELIYSIISRLYFNTDETVHGYGPNNNMDETTRVRMVLFWFIISLAHNMYYILVLQSAKAKTDLVYMIPKRPLSF